MSSCRTLWHNEWMPRTVHIDNPDEGGDPDWIKKVARERVESPTEPVVTDESPESPADE